MQTLALNTTTANTIISEVMRELLPAGSDAMHNLGEALLDGSTLDKQQIHALLQTLANNPALIKYADKKANNIRRTKAKRTAKKAVEESNSASASWRWVSQDHYHTNGARKRNRRKPLASATATANNVPTGPNVARRQPKPQPRTAPVVASIPTSTTSPDVETYQTVPVVSMTPVYLEAQEVDHDGHRSLGSLSAVELDLQANYLTMSSPSSSYCSDSEYSLSSSENPSSPFESSLSPSSSTSSTSLFEAFQQGEEDAVAWALEEAANFASQIIPSAAVQLPPFDATLPASTTSSSTTSSSSSDEGARSIDAFFSELAQWGDLPPLDMAN